MIRAVALFGIIALVVSCTTDRLVLDNAITDCGHALRGNRGDRCELATTCAAASPDQPCCTTTASCQNNLLVVDTECSPTCFTCVLDRDCMPGTICEGDRCSVCPACSGLPCPPGWANLDRNGCPACECAPLPSCAIPGPGGCPEGQCYTGAVCEPGCPGNSPPCCADQCSFPGCPEPVPAGCLMACPPPLDQTCATCGADHCECMAGAWHCTAVCAEGLVASCVAPP